MSETTEEGILFRGIWLPPGEAHLQAHLKINPMWEGKGTYQWNKLEAAVSRVPQHRRRLALDVGAHVGLWSRPLAGMFAHVVAIEPVPLHQRLWHRNVEQPNARLVGVALGPEAGKLRLTIDPQNSGATHAAAQETGDALIVEVDMVRLDEAPLPFLDLMKIDCEGYEQGVIQGGRNLIQHHRPVVIVEQKRDHSERAGFDKLGAVKLLERWGWRTVREIAGDYILEPPG